MTISLKGPWLVKGLAKCGGPFVLLGFDISYYTMAHDSKVGELGLA